MARTIFDEEVRAGLMARLDRLTPEHAARWGRMSAHRMLAHLIDQMTHTLGDVPTERIRGPLAWPLVKPLALWAMPWPRGRVEGPPEAFVTRPGQWEADVARLKGLVERLIRRGPAGRWPHHALFGPMSGRDWGRLCYRHFDHHFRQFGV